MDRHLLEMGAFFFSTSLVQIVVCAHWLATRSTPPLVLLGSLVSGLWLLFPPWRLPFAEWLDDSGLRMAVTVAFLVGAVAAYVRSDDPRLPAVLTAVNCASASLLVGLGVAVARVA